MSDSRQPPHGEPSASDPVAAIEAALDAFRGGRNHGRGPGGRFGQHHDHGGHDDGHHGGEHHHGPRDGFGPFGGLGGPGPRGFGGPGGFRVPAGPAGFGLGPVGGRAAFRLLAVLAASGPKSVSELADAVGVDQPRASRLVRAAIDANHVRREADPTDARRSILVITEAGRAVLTDAHDRRRTAIDAALADFTETERADFAALFTRFVEAWTAR